MTAIRAGHLTGGVVRAALLGGPVFVTGAALAELYAHVPQPVVLRGSDLATFGGVFLLSMIVGFPVAGLASGTGAAVMRALADRIDFLRLRIVWAGVGAAVPGVIVATLGITGSGGPIAFGLILAGAICGALSRGSLRWTDQRCAS